MATVKVKSILKKSRYVQFFSCGQFMSSIFSGLFLSDNILQ